MEFAGRMHGKTLEVRRAHFKTDKTRFTILDAPVSMSPHLNVFACNANKPKRESTTDSTLIRAAPAVEPLILTVSRTPRSCPNSV
jgi:hypothetical protein